MPTFPEDYKVCQYHEYSQKQKYVIDQNELFFSALQVDHLRVDVETKSEVSHDYLLTVTSTRAFLASLSLNLMAASDGRNSPEWSRRLYRLLTTWDLAPTPCFHPLN